MAAAQAILSNGFVEQRTSAGLREAGETVGLAEGGKAIGLPQTAKLLRLSLKLRRLNKSLATLFAGVEERGNAASREVTSLPPRTVPTEEIDRAVHSLISLHLVVEEICSRGKRHGLLNYSKFGISSQLLALQDHSDRLWGLADWLELIKDPEDVERRMADGDAEIARGDFVKIG